MWSAYLCDTTTGLIAEPVDIPSFSYSVGISESSLHTGEPDSDDSSSIELPWASIPAQTQGGREHTLRSYARGLVLCWRGSGGREIPIVFGAIGERTDSWEGTSFHLLSTLDLLERRILCPEGVFGTGQLKNQEDADYQHEGDQPGTVYSVTLGDIAIKSRTLRGIASEIGDRLTSRKPGGTLPIDWSYLGEGGTHERTYHNFNVSNNDGKKLLEALSQVSDGIDMRFRPYLKDGHVRLRFEAGSDQEHYIAQSGLVPTLTTFSGGGSLHDIKVARQGAYQRVYATGAGQDQAMLCHLSEDLRLCQSGDPTPLFEVAKNDSDWDTKDLVRKHGDALISQLSTPLIQLQGQVNLSEVPVFEAMWPGDVVDIDIRDFPTLPDGTYRMRLQEITGDSGLNVTVTFDALEDPWYTTRRVYR